MGNPPRLSRTGAAERREAVRDAKALAAAYDLSPPAAAAVCYALTNHGDWPWPDGGERSGEVLRELFNIGLVQFIGPDAVAAKMAAGRFPADDDLATEVARAWTVCRLLGIPLEQWPRLLAFDLVEWQQLARAYRAMAAVPEGGDQ